MPINIHHRDFSKTDSAEFIIRLIFVDQIFLYIWVLRKNLLQMMLSHTANPISKT